MIFKCIRIFEWYINFAIFPWFKTNFSFKCKVAREFWRLLRPVTEREALADCPSARQVDGIWFDPINSWGFRKYPIPEFETIGTFRKMDVVTNSWSSIYRIKFSFSILREFLWSVSFVSLLWKFHFPIMYPNFCLILLQMIDWTATFGNTRGWSRWRLSRCCEVALKGMTLIWPAMEFFFERRVSCYLFFRIPRSVFSKSSSQSCSQTCESWSFYGAGRHYGVDGPWSSLCIWTCSRRFVCGSGLMEL